MWCYCFVAWLPQTSSFSIGVPDGGEPADDALQLLDPTRPYKPLDVGGAGVSASVDAYGRLARSIRDAVRRHQVLANSAQSLPAVPGPSRKRERMWNLPWAKGSPQDKVDCRCGYAAAGSTV
jgi:hypothetical protein